MKNLKESVLEDLKNAMKNRDQVSLEAVRAVKSAIDKYEKEHPDQEINYVKVLKPLVSQRIDSIEQFKSAGNTELAGKEEHELSIIKNYLGRVQPKQMTSSELTEVVANAIQVNSFGKTDMGKIMAYFKANYEGQYDGKELNNIVRTILS